MKNQKFDSTTKKEKITFLELSLNGSLKATKYLAYDSPIFFNTDLELVIFNIDHLFNTKKNFNVTSVSSLVSFWNCNEMEKLIKIQSKIYSKNTYNI